jgi:mannose-6-phosphate isomerase-like protein (cupin superfamily)
MTQELLTKAQGVELGKVFERPWGTYQSVHAGNAHQVKHIVVLPGGRLSLQLHHHRSEHWVVVAGKAQATVGEETMELLQNQTAYIPQGCKHRLENLASEPLHLIEVQCGSYLGEDDIVRLEDIYGRI